VRWFLGGGLALVGVGLLLMRGLQPGDDWTALLAGMIVCGVGIGATNPALATAAIGVVPPQRAGMASGINSTFRQVGIATGIAAWGAIFQHVVASRFTEIAGGAPIPYDIADFISFGGAARSGNEALARLGEDAFVHGLNEILLLAAIVAFAGAALSAVLVRPADFVTSREPAGSAQPAPAEA
jgi:MFS family permease